MDRPVSNLNVICQESEAFYALIENVVDHIKNIEKEYINKSGFGHEFSQAALG